MQLLTLSSLLFLAERAVGAGLSFAPPFEQDGWNVGGDAIKSSTAVNLAHGANQKGSVWTKSPVKDSAFTLEAIVKSVPDFSTEVGKSGFTLWYTNKQLSGSDVHGGPDSWDGLAVMIDSLAGSGGSVRGHLNDGSTKFSSLQNLETESLSLCRIDYRRAAGGISVRVAYSEDEGFVVDVNGQKCFLSTEITLPSGYYFGITANSDVSGDTLAVERLDVTPGFNKDMLHYLPQHADQKPANEKPASEKPKPEERSESLSQQKSDGAAASLAAAVRSDGATTEDVARLVEPALHRLELVDMKLGQVQSVVDQLVETLTLSMNDVTESRKSGGSNSEVSDSESRKNFASIQKELQELRSQFSDFRKEAGSASKSKNVVASTSAPSLWMVVAVTLPVQFAAVSIYHAWLRRKERHQKLL